MINLDINKEQLMRTIKCARERNIIIPTLKQQINPEEVPKKITDSLSNVGLWEVNPLNLFRITWKNSPQPSGGLYGDVNFWEIPSALTGTKARIFALIGKWFPTGAHKVGATFGCLVPKMITGQFDPSSHKAVWPSTGNFCRGGAYNATLLGCESIAILPEEMSKERFEWLKSVAGEVIATPGCESNVKEIYDKCWELRRTRDNVVIFNQFEELGNYLWHYHVTGRAAAEIAQPELEKGNRVAGIVSSTGSAGTIAFGDFIKDTFPGAKIAAAEVLQCPTLLLNGYGGHRIEGIGDKHVPWIHNVRNTDMIVAVDDDHCLNLLRLFNEEKGLEYLKDQGVSDEHIAKLPLIGISGIGNLLSAIKFARYYELSERDMVFTVFTDSAELYGSRLQELSEKSGEYQQQDAIKDYHRYLMGTQIDNVLELNYYQRKRIHNLKYFTWIEQQGRSVEELNAQWYEYPQYWSNIQKQAKRIDELIEEFNEQTGLAKSLL